MLRPMFAHNRLTHRSRRALALAALAAALLAAFAQPSAIEAAPTHSAAR